MISTSYISEDRLHTIEEKERLTISSEIGIPAKLLGKMDAVASKRGIGGPLSSVTTRYFTPKEI